MPTSTKTGTEMTNNLKALFAAGIVATSALNAEITLTEDLSVGGYIDMFALKTPADAFSADVAEVELDFLYTTDPASAVAELSFDGTDANWETVAITYAITEELSVTGGNMLSYLGWEAYDATGLFQFSYAYRDFSPLYPAYAVGASIDYVTDQFSLGAWAGEGDGDVSYELAAKYYGVEGLTLFIGYADDPGYETLNLWASYEVDAFTFTLEWVDTETDEMDTTGYLAMINYAVGDFAITGRYSIQQDDYADSTEISDPEDWELLTISPSYSFSDNLLGLIEYSYILDGEAVSGDDYQLAVEFIYTF